MANLLSPAEREWHNLYRELSPKNRAKLYDMLSYRCATTGHYRGKPWPVVRGFLYSTGYVIPLLIIAALLLAVGLACTLTAPAAALVEVQNSPNPPAASPPPSMPATPTQPAMVANVLPPEATPKPLVQGCKVNTQALNVRACAGLECAPVAWLYAGDVATILPTPHPTDWLPIEGGWIYAKFCEVKP